MAEVVWTSRRAWVRDDRHWQPGRLRISDRSTRFTSADGTATELVVTAMRVRRRTLLLQTPEGPVRLRCFAVAAVAALLVSSRASRRCPPAREPSRPPERPTS